MVGVEGSGEDVSREQGGSSGLGGSAFKPGWHNVIPSSFNDLVAGIVGTAIAGCVCWLALGGTEAALQNLVAAFMLWLGWAIRGRVEAAKNEERPPAETRR